METIQAHIQQGEWLQDALLRIGYDMIPPDTILDKTLTGIGATSCELTASRNYIIIEPNVPVILGKTNNGDGTVIPVYANTTVTMVKNYLNRNDIQPKKLLTTPESFHKIREAASSVGINIYGDDWFCLFDECEKITQDIDYRRTISQPIYDFFLFSNKAFVSATPLKIHHNEFERQNFRKIKITPDFDFRKDITLIVTNSFDRQLRGIFAELSDSPCICIFLNKTDAVNAIIDNLQLDDYKVFCSEKSVKKLNERGRHNAHSMIDYPLAKYNFFTCRFYSALDINLYPVKPDIIMLSDLRAANYTMIDPFTEAIQIVGRFRKTANEERTFNSITHISSVSPRMTVMTDRELRRYLAQSERTYRNIKRHIKHETDANRKKSLNADLKRLEYADFLDDRGELNPFTIDNLYNEERVKSYYVSGERLLQAYNDTQHFNVRYIEDMQIVGQDDLLKFDRIKNHTELRKEIVKALHQIHTGLQNQHISQDEARDQINLLRRFDETNYILPIYNKIGFDGIERCGYHKTKLNKAVEQYDREQAESKRLNDVNVLNAINNEFVLHIYIPKKDIQNRLIRIYNRFGINCKVTQVTIKDYYEVSESNSKNPPSYKLIRFKLSGRISDPTL